MGMVKMVSNTLRNRGVRCRQKYAAARPKTKMNTMAVSVVRNVTNSGDQSSVDMNAPRRSNQPGSAAMTASPAGTSEPKHANDGCTKSLLFSLSVTSPPSAPTIRLYLPPSISWLKLYITPSISFSFDAVKSQVAESPMSALPPPAAVSSATISCCTFSKSPDDSTSRPAALAASASMNTMTRSLVTMYMSVSGFVPM